MPKAYCTSIFMTGAKKTNIYSLNIIGAFFFRFDESSFGDIFACLSMARKVYLFASFRTSTASTEVPNLIPGDVGPSRCDQLASESLTLSFLEISSEDFSEKRETTRFFQLSASWSVGFPTFFRFRLFCLGLPSSVRVGSAPCLADGKVVASALMNELHSVQLGWTGRGDTPRISLPTCVDLGILWCKCIALNYASA